MKGLKEKKQKHFTLYRLFVGEEGERNENYR